MLIAGLVLMYVSFPAAIAAWILVGVCFAGFWSTRDVLDIQLFISA